MAIVPTRNKIEKLTKDVKVNLSEEEISNFESYANFVINKVNLLDNVDTNGVEPTSFPILNTTHTLREDVVTQDDHQIIFDKAQNKKGKYIVVK
ncbi:MAG: aspartyl/glutamyl-tRNA amidotransferase subunit C [Mycoplasmataceae bacterium]|jgi:aspartyl/glutamyl-tRNA(Asn/Gln) amidotransferase C subunit|nr:aspartyl/glutamyl-tRNA amidotransferase subunit C [Mycoplasmataceae bacterium]